MPNAERVFTGGPRDLWARPRGAHPSQLPAEPIICGPRVPLHGKTTPSSLAGSHRAAPHASRGFTLVELIVTLLVAGILALVVIPKFSNVSSIQQRSDYDKVVSAIKYARKSAIAQRRYVCVSLTASSATFTIDPNPPEATATPFGGACPFANALALPAPDGRCGATNQTCLTTVTMSSTSNVFQFDARGRALSKVLITVSSGPAVTVEAETGYVH
jgi:MSHA pilin protein MshC